MATIYWVLRVGGGLLTKHFKAEVWRLYILAHTTLLFHLQPPFFIRVYDIGVLKTLYGHYMVLTCLSIACKLLWQVSSPHHTLSHGRICPNSGFRPFLAARVVLPYCLFIYFYFLFRQIYSNCTQQHNTMDSGEKEKTEKDQWLRNGVVTDVSYSNPSIGNKEMRHRRPSCFSLISLLFPS